jgi:hypothetical protein
MLTRCKPGLAGFNHQQVDGGVRAALAVRAEYRRVFANAEYVTLKCISREFETIPAIAEDADHPQKIQSVTVNSTSRGRQNQWLSLCASQKALTASDIVIVADAEKGEFMRTSLDLFRRNKDGKFIWLEAGEDLKAAKLRLQELSAGAPGEYLLFDRRTAQIIERLHNNDVCPS